MLFDLVSILLRLLKQFGQILAMTHMSHLHSGNFFFLTENANYVYAHEETTRLANDPHMTRVKPITSMFIG